MSVGSALARASTERGQYAGLVKFTKTHLRAESKGKRGFWAEVFRNSRVATIEKEIDKLVRSKMKRGVSSKNKALEDIADDLLRITTWDPKNPQETLEDDQAAKAAIFLRKNIGRLLQDGASLL